MRSAPPEAWLTVKLEGFQAETLFRNFVNAVMELVGMVTVIASLAFSTVVSKMMKVKLGLTFFVDDETLCEFNQI